LAASGKPYFGFHEHDLELPVKGKDGKTPWRRSRRAIANLKGFEANGGCSVMRVAGAPKCLGSRDELVNAVSTAEKVR
jgi:hypothetical protein